MSVRRLRYTGARRQTFTAPGVGEVEPGAEFGVPEDEAERYLRRGDIEDATPKPGRKPKGEGASDEASASQDGETNGGSPSGEDGLSDSPTGNDGTGEQ